MTFLCVAQLVPSHHGMFFSNSLVVNVVVKLAQIKNIFWHTICIMHFWLLCVLSFMEHKNKILMFCEELWVDIFGELSRNKKKEKKRTSLFSWKWHKIIIYFLACAPIFFLCHSNKSSMYFFLFKFLLLCEHNVFRHHVGINQMNLLSFTTLTSMDPLSFTM